MNATTLELINRMIEDSRNQGIEWRDGDPLKVSQRDDPSLFEFSVLEVRHSGRAGTGDWSRISRRWRDSSLVRA